MLRLLYLSFLMFMVACLTQSCLVISAGAAGGSYAWFNGRLEEKLYHDKEHAYDIAKAYLGAEEVTITLDDEENYRLEGQVKKDVKGQVNTYKISFIFKAYKVKDLSTMTKYQKEKMEKEKGLKTLLIFQYTDGIKPQLSEAEAELKSYLSLLN